MFSPMVSAPLTWCPRRLAGASAAYWSISLPVSASNAARSSAVHQSLQRAASVVLRALVVEAVADLVADDRADRAVVDRVVGRRVEERRLQDGGREDDLVHARVVVGVDRLRRHEPLVAVDRAADLGQLAVEFEGGRPAGVADQVVRAMTSAGVVPPLGRVADLRGERRQLVQRPRLGVSRLIQRSSGCCAGRPPAGCSTSSSIALLGLRAGSAARRRAGRPPRRRRTRRRRRRASTAPAARGVPDSVRP